MTVSDATRDEAWVLLCDLERNVRYFGTLGDRYRVLYRSIRYFLLLGVLSEGFAVYLFSVYPVAGWGLGVLLALLLAGLTVFDSVTNYAESSAEFRSAALMCGDIQVEASRLWRDIESSRLADGDAEERLGQIIHRWSSAARMVSLELHPSDNRKAAIEASKVISDRYGL